MARFRAGKDMFLRWVHPGGTIDFSADYSRFNVDLAADLLDATGGNVDDSQFIVGLKSGRANLTIFDTQTQGTVYEAAFAEGTFGTLIWGRRGTVAGRPKRGIAAYVKSFKNPLDHGAVSVFEVEFEKSGAMVFGPTSIWP